MCFVWVLAILAPIGLSRAAMAVLPLNADQGLYVTIGQVIKRGGVVGRDTWDNKPPGSYYLYAGLLALAPDYSEKCKLRGALLPQSDYELSCAQVLLSVFDALYAAALSVAVWLIGRQLFDSLVGGLAAWLCATFASMIQILHGGGIPDFHALLPCTLAYMAVFQYSNTHRPWFLVLAGANAGLEILFKQTGIVLLAGIGVWLIVRAVRTESWPRGVLIAARENGLLGLGVVAVLGAAAAILVPLGALRDVVEQAILFNRSYVTSPGNVNGLLTQARLETSSVFVDSQSGLWVAALGSLALFRRAVVVDSRIGLLAAWVVASVASVFLGGAHFIVYYYLALVPPLSLCGGWALATAWKVSRAPWRMWLVAAAATLLFYAGQFQLHQFGNAWYSRVESNTHSAEEFVAGSIKDGSGSLFVWGNGSQVYALSGRSPASRFLHTLALSNDFAVNDQVVAHRAELMARLNTAPPAVVVLDTLWLTRSRTLDFPELRALLAREYELTNNPSNPIFSGWQIYRRR